MAAAGGTTKAADRLLCPRCGPPPNLQQVATSRVLENTDEHVVTCVRLACGHTWHRAIRNIGGIFPGSPRNATVVPCDCVAPAPAPA
jgi:hypothetical protein